MTASFPGVQSAVQQGGMAEDDGDSDADGDDDTHSLERQRRRMVELSHGTLLPVVPAVDHVRVTTAVRFTFSFVDLALQRSTF